MIRHTFTLSTGLFAFVCLFATACQGGGDNPLIGRWKFTRLTGPNNQSCKSTAEFKDKAALIGYAAVPADPNNAYSKAVPARVANVPVIRYMPSASLVVVLTGGAGYPMDHSNYNFVDKDHMWDETAYGRCYYERTN